MAVSRALPASGTHNGDSSDITDGTVRVPGGCRKHLAWSPVGAPEVSVIVAVYNGATTIARTLRSILDQRGVTLEIIVVDDGSTDDTAAVVEDVADTDRRVRVISSVANEGRSAARNHGVRAARGRFVTAVDADDLIHPLRLATMLTATAGPDAADIVIDDIVVFDHDENGTRLHSRLVWQSSITGSGRRPFRVWPWLRDSRSAKPLIRRSVIEEVGAEYPEHLSYGEDLGFLCQAMFAPSGPRTVRWADVLYYYRREPENWGEDADRIVRELRASLEHAATVTDSAELAAYIEPTIAVTESNPDTGDERRRRSLRQFLVPARARYAALRAATLVHDRGRLAAWRAEIDRQFADPV